MPELLRRRRLRIHMKVRCSREFVCEPWELISYGVSDRFRRPLVAPKDRRFTCAKMAGFCQPGRSAAAGARHAPPSNDFLRWRRCMGAPEILGSALSFPPIETRAEFKARNAKEDAGHRPPRPRALGRRPSRGLTRRKSRAGNGSAAATTFASSFPKPSRQAPTISRPSL